MGTRVPYGETSERTLALVCVCAVVATLSSCQGAVGTTDDATGGGGSGGEGAGATGGDDVNVSPGAGGTGVTVNQKAFAPMVAHMFRLTREQVSNIVNDVFGNKVNLTKPIEADETNEVFLAEGAASVATSARGVEQYEDAAFDVATQALAQRSAIAWLAACQPKSESDACIAKLVADVGQRLWRRPLSDAEVRAYASIVGLSGSDAAARDMGMTYLLAALLQSPNFIYVAFVGEPDDATGMRRLTGYEMASRLSLFLWNSGPDAELLAAAGAGKLDEVAGITEQAARMLAHPRARAMVTKFFSESWKVSRLNEASKDPSVFPDWSPALLESYKGEFRRVLEDIVFERDADIREVLTGTKTFADAAVAKAYGITVSGSGFVSANLRASQSGLLTSGAVMAANAFSQRTSPTQRGVFVREQILCDEVPAPMQGVDTSLKEADANLPLRERLAEHRTNPACASCHALFDPIGLAFEEFDGMGRYRSTEAGKAIKTSGTIDDEPFSDPRGLAAFVSRQPRTATCLAKQLLTFATGGEVGEKQEGAVELVAERTTQANHSFKKLVLNLVASPAFRFIEKD